MTTPNIFISHRWTQEDEYKKLVDNFDKYGLYHLNYSVPKDDPLDANSKKKIEDGLREQVRQSNYLIIFATMRTANSDWCKYEIDVATEYGKPILSVKPYGYTGNIPVFVQLADTEGGPVGFNTPALIRKICNRLNHPVPDGV